MNVGQGSEEARAERDKVRGKSADKSTRGDEDSDDNDDDDVDDVGWDDRCDSGERATCERRRCIEPISSNSCGYYAVVQCGRSNDAGWGLKRKQSDTARFSDSASFGPRQLGAALDTPRVETETLKSTRNLMRAPAMTLGNRRSLGDFSPS